MSTPMGQIPSQRCWELLATVSVGHLALSVRALPVILPAQYYVTGHRLAVCLGHHAIPDRSLNHSVVAFTADGFDTSCGQPTAGQLVEIEPATLTGYYVHLCPLIDTRLADGQTPA